jgi:transposase InsO family protein
VTIVDAWRTGRPPGEAKRRYGSTWQRPRRELERRVRRAAVAVRRLFARHQVSRGEAAGILGVSAATIRSWEDAWRTDRLQSRPRGRPVTRSPVGRRNAVLAAFRGEGGHVGVAPHRSRFPGVPRRELEDLMRRWKRARGRRARRCQARLQWLRPGAVWAADHTGPSRQDAGRLRLAVRDLASGQQIEWTPVEDASGATTGRYIEARIDDYGPPLVFKSDNGAAFRSEKFAQVLRRHGVLHLRSPVRRPGYNGSCEAAIGSMKRRTAHFASQRAGHLPWTAEDCESALRQANETARPEGPCGPTPQERWTARVEISDHLRSRFAQSARKLREELREERFGDSPINLDRSHRERLDRDAIQAALVACGILNIRRRRISPPF